MPEPDPDLQAFGHSRSAAHFRRLVDRHIDAVHSTARRVLGARAHLAEDVAQLVFVRLAEKAGALPPTIVVGAWLHRQTVRLALNTVRAESRRERREQRSLEPDPDQAMTTDPAGPAWAELMPHVDRAILELGETDRQAISLRFHERQQHAAIAARLGLSKAAVEKRIARALDKLRERLARRGITLGAAALGSLLATHTVQPAPAALAASVTATVTDQVLNATTLTTTLTAMTIAKSLLVGATLGVVAGGVWATARPAPPTLLTGTATPPPGPVATAPTASENAPARYAVPAPARTDAEIFAQLQHILESPDNEITRLRLRTFLGGLDSPQSIALHASTEENFNSIQRTRVLPLLAGAWALNDPQAATTALITTRGRMAPGWSARQLLFTAFRTWQGADSPAAQHWLVDNQNAEQFKKHVPELIAIVSDDLVGSSEEKAITWASQLDGEDYQAAALSALWTRYTDDPASDDKTGHLARLVDRFEALHQHDPGLAALASRNLGRTWARFRTGEFEAWLDRQEPGPVPYQLAASAVTLNPMQRNMGLVHIK